MNYPPPTNDGRPRQKNAKVELSGMKHAALPGGDIVDSGLNDLEAGVESVEALLVSMAATRLRRLGIQVPPGVIESPEAKLHELLEAQHGAAAHSRYNAWRRRILSFLRTAPCAKE